MGFLEKVSKTVGHGVSRVTTEADKAIRLTRLSGELGGKRHDLDKAYQELGRLAYGLMAEGKFQDDSLTEARQKIDGADYPGSFGAEVDRCEERRSEAVGRAGSAYLPQRPAVCVVGPRRTAARGLAGPLRTTGKQESPG